MAPWQVELHLIPRTVISPAVVRTLDTGSWWSAASFPKDYQRRLDKVAPRGGSGGVTIERWGTDQGNRVDVVLQDGVVQRVIARVDVRKLDSTFGAALIHFARAAGALLVRRDGLIIEPTIAAYAAALRSSEEWRVAGETGVASRLPVAQNDGDEGDD